MVPQEDHLWNASPTCKASDGGKQLFSNPPSTLTLSDWVRVHIRFYSQSLFFFSWVSFLTFLSSPHCFLLTPHVGSQALLSFNHPSCLPLLTHSFKGLPPSWLKSESCGLPYPLTLRSLCVITYEQVFVVVVVVLQDGSRYFCKIEVCIINFDSPTLSCKAKTDFISQDLESKLKSSNLLTLVTPSFGHRNFIFLLFLFTKIFTLLYFFLF